MALKKRYEVYCSLCDRYALHATHRDDFKNNGYNRRFYRGFNRNKAISLHC